MSGQGEEFGGVDVGWGGGVGDGDEDEDEDEDEDNGDERRELGVLRRGDPKVTT